MGAEQSTHYRRLDDPAPASAPPPAPAPAPAPAPVPRLRPPGLARAQNVRFRVLIIGRESAGKTSISQKLCDTTESPEIYRARRWGRRWVRTRSRWHFRSHGNIRVKLGRSSPTIEVGWSYFCQRQLIMKIPLTA